jgi:general secretion pathway protein K
MALIAGSMEDAQSRYNLRNLVENGQIVESEVEALRRLCGLLQVAEQTADLIAQRMQEALPAAAVPDENGRMPDNAISAEKVRPIPLMFPEDLIGVPGISAEAAQRLAPYIVVSRRAHADQREHRTARGDRARVQDSLSDARARPSVSASPTSTTSARFVLRLGEGKRCTRRGISPPLRAFFVRGRSELDRAVTRMEALVRRGVPGQGIQPVNVYGFAK